MSLHPAGSGVVAIERLSLSADLLDRWIGVVDAGAVDS